MLRHLRHLLGKRPRDRIFEALTMMEHRGWFAVRCCCTPTKIFGFMQLPVSKSRHHVRDRYGDVHEVEIRTISGPCPTMVAPESIDDFRPLPLTAELAIYSDDRPIDFWRSIVGFVEAFHDEGRP